MEGLLLPSCSIFFSTLLIIIYFSKKRVNLIENKVYSIMIICSVIDSILVTILQAISLNGVSSLEITFVPFLNKIDFVSIILYGTCVLIYTILITLPKTAENFKKVLLPISIIDVLVFLILIISEIKVITNGNITTVGGTAVNIVYVVCGLYLITSIVISLLNIKNTDKRHIPIFSILVIIISLLLLYTINPYIIIISITLTFINYLMYFTIENPDVKLLEQVSLAKTQAEKANAAKTDFLSNMSHEIRTPLNAIVGFSEAIKEADSLEEAKEDAKDIIAASQNLLEIVNGILDISKIEANKMEIVNTEYNLRKECELLAKLIKTRIGEKPITLNVNIAPDIPERLYGDKSKVKEILSNILTNAVKYTKEGQIDFIVSCINKGNESSLVLSVEDTGRGIKPENIDKLFNKFERLDEDRNTTTEGAGLGLAITKKLVEMLNGKIIVQSVYGSGSKFTVYLKQRIIDNTNYMNKKIEAPKSELILSNKKILIVDDNEMNLKIATKLLEKYNPIIECCFSGYECLEKIKNGSKYDLILMDDMMPKMSGTETLHILNDDPNFKDKVVVLTANAIEGMKEKYIEDGFDDYLSKPIEKQELERVLRKFLNKEIEPVEFAPLPDEIFEISDDAIEKINDKN